ncbi:hypothetical protein NAI82_04245 [Oxalobacter sp. JAC-2022]|uniref:hypothetical protein n=1 Tax=Oxalobacter aliiformigenes TaxID=2946593 RepID=UPI0022AE79EE|nr:hypothetical protein [Oxalobacter aliiformigenes]MCZ4064641.1 hypothetical protein [Oxalobacter aliiformigenes]
MKRIQTVRYCRIGKSATGTTETTGTCSERSGKTFSGRKWKNHISFWGSNQQMYVFVYSLPHTLPIIPV